MNWSDLPLVMTLDEVAPIVRKSRAYCYELLRKGRFPIRYIDARPYLFARDDVEAYATKGTKTNPLLQDKQPRRRRYFGRAAAMKVPA